MSFQRFTSEYKSDREYLRGYIKSVEESARKFREVIQRPDVLEVPDEFFGVLDELQFHLSQLIEEIIHLEIQRGPREINEAELPLALRQTVPVVVVNQGGEEKAVKRQAGSSQAREERKYMFTLQAGLSLIEYFDKMRDFYNRARVYLQFYSQEDYPEAHIQWKDYFLSKIKQHGSSLASLVVMYSKAAILRDEEVIREAYYRIVAARNSAGFGVGNFGRPG